MAINGKFWDMRKRLVDYRKVFRPKFANSHEDCLQFVQKQYNMRVALIPSPCKDNVSCSVDTYEATEKHSGQKFAERDEDALTLPKP